MKHTSEDRLALFSNLLQTELFPLLEAAVGTLGRQARLLASVVSLQPLAKWTVRSARRGGRPCRRQSLVSAFLAKAIYNLPTTRHLIQRLEGHTTAPSVRLGPRPASAHRSHFLARFRRVRSGRFAYSNPRGTVEQSQQQNFIEHIARDSTAIHARQRPKAARARSL